MISIKVTGIKAQLKRLDPYLVRKAAARAINRVASKGATAARRGITARYTIKQKDIKKNIRVAGKAKPGDLKALLSATGSRIRLIKFQHRIIKTTSRRLGGPGVRVKVLKAGGYKRMAHGFMGELTTLRGGDRVGIGKETIYERMGAKRFPLRSLTGPSPQAMFVAEEVQAKMANRITEEFLKEFEHELQWQLNKVGK